jgi:hypothetical protein
MLRRSEGELAVLRRVGKWYRDNFGERSPKKTSVIPYDENGLIQWVDPETEALCRRYTEAIIAIEDHREQLRRERYQEEAQINAGLSID